MRTEVAAVATASSEENRVTSTPPRGAFAGELLESCSWTTSASYGVPSAGRTGGKPYKANL